MSGLLMLLMVTGLWLCGTVAVQLLGFTALALLKFAV